MAHFALSDSRSVVHFQSVLTTHPTGGGHSYDRVFRHGEEQSEVFDEAAREVVLSTMDGYNGTVIAYGQTGTGKTFTIEGAKGKDRGVIPRACEEIFNQIESTQSEDIKYLVRVSFFQIYNERISDLLQRPRRGRGVDGGGRGDSASSAATSKSSFLNVREDGHGETYVDGLSEHIVKSPADIQELLRRGQHARATAATTMNQASSRSHAVFTVIVERSVPNAAAGENTVTIGKLNMVDLAGSERVKNMDADVLSASGRLDEAKMINSSLSTFGKVVLALTSSESRHVPYRDSKLTRILQASLGGNCKTCLITTVGPSSESYSDSLNSLKFAYRAKDVKNYAMVNQDMSDQALLTSYQREVKRLRVELDKHKKQSSRAIEDSGAILELRRQHTELTLENERKQTELEARARESKKHEDEKRALAARLQQMEQQMLHGGAARSGTAGEVPHTEDDLEASIASILRDIDGEHGGDMHAAIAKAHTYLLDFHRHKEAKMAQEKRDIERERLRLETARKEEDGATPDSIAGSAVGSTSSASVISDHDDHSNVGGPVKWGQQSGVPKPQFLPSHVTARPPPKPSVEDIVKGPVKVVPRHHAETFSDSPGGASTVSMPPPSLSETRAKLNGGHTTISDVAANWGVNDDNSDVSDDIDNDIEDNAMHNSAEQSAFDALGYDDSDKNELEVEEPVESVLDELMDPETGIPTRDIQFGNEVRSGVFSGVDALGWFVDNVDGLADESDALRLGQHLVDAGDMVRLDGELHFEAHEDVWYELGRGSLDEMEPLHEFALSGDIKGLKEELQFVHVDALAGSNRTALMIAAMNNRLNCVSLLIRYGCDTRLQDVDGRTALLWAAYSGHTRIVKVLIRASQSTVGVPDKDGRTALHWSTRQLKSGCLSALASASPPAAVNRQDNSGITPLHWAVLYDNSRHIGRLLRMGAATSIADKEGRAPLHYAVADNKVACLRALLKDVKVNVNAPDSEGRTALHLSANCNDTECLAVLLKHVSINVNARDQKGTSALHWAAVSNNVDACCLLVQHEADLKAKDDSGMTPIEHAQTQGYIECVQALEDLKVNPMAHIEHVEAPQAMRRSSMGAASTWGAAIAAVKVQNRLKGSAGKSQACIVS